MTKFTDGRVLWPSMGYDGKSVVFERDFKIWQLDTKTGEAYPVPITLVGSAASPEITHLSINQFTDLAVSADNRKIALVAHGEVFASSARDGGRAFRVTETPGPESQVAWAPDSMHLAYVSQRDALTHVFLYDFAKHAETQLTSGPLPDQAPVFSPDGKTLAFVRDRKELRAIDLASKQERLLATGFIGGGFGGGSVAWAPDNQWIAYASDAERGLRNVFVVPAAGGTPRQVSFLANGSLNSLEWSPDGKFLIFQTSQRTEQAEVMRLDLALRQPKFAEEKFEDLFKPETTGRGGGRGAGRGGDPAANAPAEPKAPVKVEIDFNDIRRRIAPLALGTGISNPQISPDGRYLLFSASAAGQSNLYLYLVRRGSRRRARWTRWRWARRGRGARRSPTYDNARREDAPALLGRFARGLLSGRRARAIHRHRQSPDPLGECRRRDGCRFPEGKDGGLRGGLGGPAR